MHSPGYSDDFGSVDDLAASDANQKEVGSVIVVQSFYPVSSSSVYAWLCEADAAIEYDCRNRYPSGLHPRANIRSRFHVGRHQHGDHLAGGVKPDHSQCCVSEVRRFRLGGQQMHLCSCVKM